MILETDTPNSFRILPGRSAIEYAPISKRLASCSLGLLGLSVVITIIGIAFSSVPIVLILMIFILGGLFGFSAMGVSYVSQLKEAEEVKHGYTTLLDAHEDVMQLNPLTGHAIRAAGEPLLIFGEFRDRLETDYRAQLALPDAAVSNPRKPSLYRRRSKWDYLAHALVCIGMIVAIILKARSQ